MEQSKKKKYTIQEPVRLDEYEKFFNTHSYGIPVISTPFGKKTYYIC
jgi:hypothetical protein